MRPFRRLELPFNDFSIRFIRAECREEMEASEYTLQKLPNLRPDLRSALVWTKFLLLRNRFGVGIFKGKGGMGFSVARPEFFPAQTG